MPHGFAGAGSQDSPRGAGDRYRGQFGKEDMQWQGVVSECPINRKQSRSLPINRLPITDPGQVPRSMFVLASGLPINRVSPRSGLKSNYYDGPFCEGGFSFSFQNPVMGWVAS